LLTLKMNIQEANVFPNNNEFFMFPNIDANHSFCRTTHRNSLCSPKPEDNPRKWFMPWHMLNRAAACLAFSTIRPGSFVQKSCRSLRVFLDILFATFPAPKMTSTYRVFAFVCPCPSYRKLVFFENIFDM
jgi:hypothetical protein